MNEPLSAEQVLDRIDIRTVILNVIAIFVIMACFFYVGHADYADAVRTEQAVADSACVHAVKAASRSARDVHAVRVDSGVTTVYVCNVAKVAS